MVRIGCLGDVSWKAVQELATTTTRLLLFAKADQDTQPKVIEPGEEVHIEPDTSEHCTVYLPPEPQSQSQMLLWL